MIFSRRDFLKLAGFGVFTSAILAGCGPAKKEANQNLPLMDRLNTHDSPWHPNNLETSISLGDIKVEMFGPINPQTGEPTMRVLRQTDIKNFRNAPSVKGFGFGDDEAHNAVNDIKAIYDDAQEVLVIQHNVFGKWESIALPGSVSQLSYSIELDTQLNLTSGVEGETADTNEIVMNKAKMYCAFSEASSTLEQAYAIVDEVFPGIDQNNYWKNLLLTIRQLHSDIPESTPIDAVSSILKADLFPVSNAPKYDIFAQYLEKIGIPDAVFVPKENKFNEKFISGIKAWKEMHLEIDEKPKVYVISQTNKLTNESVLKVFVHQPGTNKNKILDNNGQFGSIPNDVFNQMIASGAITSAIDLNSDAAKDVINFFGLDENILISNATQICEVNPDFLRAYFIPNKLIGGGEMRFSWGLPYVANFDKDGVSYIKPTPSVMLFSDTMRDHLFPMHMRDKWWDNWIVDFTPEIQKMIDNGVKQFYKLGVFSPVESIARLMMGFQDDLLVNKSILPSSDYLTTVLASTYIGNIFDDELNKEQNMAVAGSDLLVLRLTATDYANWVKTVGTKLKDWTGSEILPTRDDVTVTPALEEDGSQVILRKGEMVPFGEILEVNGVKYIAFIQTNRDELSHKLSTSEWGVKTDSNFVDKFLNWAIKDGVDSVLVVPYDEAIKNIIALDPDPNLYEAIMKVSKVLIVSSLIVATAVAPEAAGLAAAAGATYTGYMVRNAVGPIFNFFSTLPGKLLSGVLSQ